MCVAITPCSFTVARCQVAEVTESAESAFMISILPELGQQGLGTRLSSWIRGETQSLTEP